MINNFLPSKAELKRRHIREEGHRAACGNPSETLFHALVKCPWAKRFWKIVKELTERKLPDLHPMTWATDLIGGSVCSTEEAALFVCGCWSLWTSHNARDHGQTNRNPATAAKHVANMVEELLCLDMKSNKMDARPADQWRPPEDGCVKVNSDGSFDAARGQGAGAAVLRDHRGQILAAQAKWFGSVQEVLVTEALAARDGLKLASDLGLPRIVLESDSSMLVNAIKSSTMLDRSIIAGI
jgi:hypothetical protein